MQTELTIPPPLLLGPGPEMEPRTARWLARIRTEYLEMPGLGLTLPQARRLWGLDELTNDALFETLVDAQFLRKTASGTYVRADLG